MADSDPRLDPYDYALPQERIATYPAAARDGARLLVLDHDGPVDSGIALLGRHLSPGDLVVANDTRVMAARVRARRATGGEVELLFLEPGDQLGRARAMVRPGRRLRPGEELAVGAVGRVRMERVHEDGAWTVRAWPDPLALMEAAGHVPLPPYIQRADEDLDRERYQTVFAGAFGAVAAPTAGLHLSEALLDGLAERGVHFVTITLHVGPGTFRNLRAADLERGTLHAEAFAVPARTADAVREARRRGGRVVAVGTTTTRTLEAVGRDDGTVAAGRGSTDLFIREPFRFRVVDALLTNFHLPRSSLLMLVCAFGGRERVMAAYRHAVAAGYRFYSYGDAMFLPRRVATDEARSRAP